MKILYHYTSFQNFLKIISSHKLRFSDVKKSNDYQEIEYLWKTVIENNRRIKTNDKLLNFLHKEQNKVQDYLSISFSENGNSLEMFNNYKADISIGFDINGIKKWISRISFFNNKIYYFNKSNHDFCKLKKIKYLNDNDILNDLLKKKKRNSNDNFNYITDYLLENEYSIKTNYWEKEKEFRCVLPIIYSTHVESSETFDLNDSLEININSVYSSEHNYKQCCDVPFDNILIKEIVINRNSKIDNNDIEKILLSCGFSIDDIDIYNI